MCIVLLFLCCFFHFWLLLFFSYVLLLLPMLRFAVVSCVVVVTCLSLLLLSLLVLFLVLLLLLLLCSCFQVADCWKANLCPFLTFQNVVVACCCCYSMCCCLQKRAAVFFFFFALLCFFCCLSCFRCHFLGRRSWQTHPPVLQCLKTFVFFKHNTIQTIGMKTKTSTHNREVHERIHFLLCVDLPTLLDVLKAWIRPVGFSWEVINNLLESHSSLTLLKFSNNTHTRGMLFTLKNPFKKNQTLQHHSVDVNVFLCKPRQLRLRQLFFQLRPNLDFGQISTSAKFGVPRGWKWPQEGGRSPKRVEEAQEGGGSPRGWRRPQVGGGGPHQGGSGPTRVEAAPKGWRQPHKGGGGPKVGWRPRRVEPETWGPKISRFFSPPPTTISFEFCWYLWRPAEGCPAESCSAARGVNFGFKKINMKRERNKNKSKEKQKIKTRTKTWKRERRNRANIHSTSAKFRLRPNFDLGQFDFGQLSEIELARIEHPRVMGHKRSEHNSMKTHWQFPQRNAIPNMHCLHCWSSNKLNKTVTSFPLPFPWQHEYVLPVRQGRHRRTWFRVCYGTPKHPQRLFLPFHHAVFPFSSTKCLPSNQQWEARTRPRPDAQHQNRRWPFPCTPSWQRQLFCQPPPSGPTPLGPHFFSVAVVLLLILLLVAALLVCLCSCCGLLLPLLLLVLVSAVCTIAAAFLLRYTPPVPFGLPTVEPPPPPCQCDLPKCQKKFLPSGTPLSPPFGATPLGLNFSGFDSLHSGLLAPVVVWKNHPCLLWPLKMFVLFLCCFSIFCCFLMLASSCCVLFPAVRVAFAVAFAVHCCQWCCFLLLFLMCGAAAVAAFAASFVAFADGWCWFVLLCEQLAAACAASWLCFWVICLCGRFWVADRWKTHPCRLTFQNVNNNFYNWKKTPVTSENVKNNFVVSWKKHFASPKKRIPPKSNSYIVRLVNNQQGPKRMVTKKQ